MHEIDPKSSYDIKIYEPLASISLPLPLALYPIYTVLYQDKFDVYTLLVSTITRNASRHDCVSFKFHISIPKFSPCRLLATYNFHFNKQQKTASRNFADIVALIN